MSGVRLAATRIWRRGCPIRGILLPPPKRLMRPILSKVLKSTLRDTIVGSDTRIEHPGLSHSIVGDHVVIEKFFGEATIGDHGEMRRTS